MRATKQNLEDPMVLHGLDDIEEDSIIGQDLRQLPSDRRKAETGNETLQALHRVRLEGHDDDDRRLAQ